MKNRVILNKMAILLLFFFVVSCYSDKGNYDYVDVNLVTVVNSEDSSYYAVSKVDTIRINPIISATLDPDANNSDRYEYQWSVGGIKTKELVYPVELRATNYIFSVTVTDKKTGLVAEGKWTVEVAEQFQKGYVILTENNEQEAQLDMVSIFGSDTIVMINVSKGQLPPLKNPKSIFMGPMGGSGGEIYVIGANDTYKISRTNFAYDVATGNFKDNFIGTDELKDFNVTHILDPFRNRLTIVDGNAFYAAIAGTILYDYPINRYPKKYTPFQVAPKAAINYLNSQSIDRFVLYNLEEKRFVYRAERGVTCDSLTNSKSDIAIFDWKTGLDFVTTVHSYFGRGDSFTILKDNKGGYFLYEYEIRDTWGSKPEKKGRFDISSAPGIEKATHFCFSSKQPFFFYNSGTKVYGFDFNKINTTFELEMGAQVTCLYDNYKFEQAKDFIYISTYDGTELGGKIVKKHIINSPNKVGLEDPVDANNNPVVTEWKGLNRVIDMIYKQ